MLQGGSYTKNAKSGKVTLVSRTKSVSEARDDAAKKSATNKKTTKSGEKP